MNHHIYRQDGPSNHSGGVLIAIKKNISFHKVSTIPTYLETLEAICVEISASPKPLLIVSIYKHPGTSDPLLWENFTSFFKSFSHAHIVLTEDFNAHHTSWGCHHSDLTGKSSSFRSHSRTSLVHHQRWHSHSSQSSTLSVVSHRSHICLIFSYSLHSLGSVWW